MKTRTSSFLIAVVVAIVVMLAVWKFADIIHGKEKAELLRQVRIEKIKNDSLVNLGEGMYTKLVADTLTLKQLNKLNDSLKLELKNPKIITEIVTIIKEIEKPIDNVQVKDSIVTIEDFYPSKKDKFITYNSKININTSKGIGKFRFEKLPITLGIGQNKDGTYYVNTKLPEFMEVTKLDVQSQPIVEEVEDNFGWLVGVGAGNDYQYGNKYLTLSTGIRYKKLYLEVEGATNKTLEVGIKTEF